MTGRGAQGLTWDVENRPTAIGTESYVYDGDGNRISKTVGGVKTLNVNKYYEKNTGTGTVTTSYYLGDKLVVTREGTTLTYIHQESLNSTSVTSSSTGALVSGIKYYPFATGFCARYFFFHP
jgi:YD repeat-containing protein